ncbi:unnamed protein product [Clonostachys rhizophaga]|uniref:Zn(2)-C6 fungal-type domain-containing protein n=1 Tax=Clonostachys rhizophaga TaxID=160324 RepID=A0A9N9YLE2_9HYPO|nr:unnamed protein product [Clonostachys rhizophaga]
MDGDQAAQQGSAADDLFAGMSRNPMPSTEQIQRAALELGWSPAYLFSRLYPGSAQGAHHSQQTIPSTYGTTPSGVTLSRSQQRPPEEQDDIAIDLILGDRGEGITGRDMSDLTMDQQPTVMQPTSQSTLPADDASGRAEDLPAGRPHTCTDGQGSGSTDITPSSNASWVEIARKPPSALGSGSGEDIRFPNRPKNWPAIIGLSRSVKLPARRRRGPKPNKARRQPQPKEKASNPCYFCRLGKRGCDDGIICKPCEKRLTPLRTGVCLRYEVSDAALFRVQQQPAQRASQRWATMDMVDLDANDWESGDILTIHVTPTILHAPIELKLRKFIPNSTDVTFRSWWGGSQMTRYDMPPYAIANLAEAAQSYGTVIDKYVAIFVEATVRHHDELIQRTYSAALWHAEHTQEFKEKDLLITIFRFWVACRITSTSLEITGREKLGLAPVNDESSNMHGKVPLPPIITPQEQIIVYSGFLIPLSKKIVSQLGLFLKNANPKMRYPSYLGLFIILHSCSMLTRRNKEYARQINHTGEYVNPDAISALHSGAITMLAHFHVNHGTHLFDPVTTSGCLEPSQIQVLAETSRLVQAKSGLFATIRKERWVWDDLYWASQLYDTKWEPDKQP